MERPIGLDIPLDRKDFEKRTLLETAHLLPLYGENCKFWRAKEDQESYCRVI